MAWKDLTIAQRSQLMNIMRHNGISSLSEMRRIYDLSSPSLSSLGENTFNMQHQAPVYAKGGNLFKTGGPAGNIVPALVGLAAKKAKKKYLSDYAKSGYMYTYPNNPLKMVQYIISPYMKTDNYGNRMLEDFDPNITNARRELFARYFNLNPDELGLNGALIKSGYTPTNAADANAKYYTLPGKDAIERMNNFSQVAGEYKVSLGEDEKGRYFSIYDVWDLAPFSGYGNEFKNTSPVELYDRIYESESPDLYKYFSESTDTHIADNKGSFSSGGKIHIKPENRGKFTALKKRTGHSASWFKAHGTPAQKKMAIFALNSRHWGKKKLHGGVKF